VAGRDRFESTKEHFEIIRAVAENRPDDAERFARQHVQRSAESIAKLDLQDAWVAGRPKLTDQNGVPARAPDLLPAGKSPSD
jgi:hypothetical protein